MMEITMIAGTVLFAGGLLGFRALNRAIKKRHDAGQPKLPRPLRIAVALLALGAVIGGPALLLKTFIGATQRNQRLAEELAQSGERATARRRAASTTSALR
jgi:hypothetical protein